ncbi:hypothetical protein FRC02_011792 [Tulasnella sp. 418]|nr:hypothetical protein FRC02_011792 [Tulasnella sp. 418]
MRLAQKQSRFGMSFSHAVVTTVKPKQTLVGGPSKIRHTVYSDDEDLRYLASNDCHDSSCLAFGAWDMRTYTNVPGFEETFHRTSTQFEVDRRGVIFDFPTTVSAIRIYGAPLSQLRHGFGEQEVCIRPLVGCFPVDVERAYERAGMNFDEPVLLWSIDRLDETQLYTLELGLIDQPNLREMTFSRLEYVEAGAPSRSPSRGGWRWRGGGYNNCRPATKWDYIISGVFILIFAGMYWWDYSRWPFRR